MSKVTIKAAADYLGIPPMMLTLGMRNNLLPIGFAVKSEETYRDSWSHVKCTVKLVCDVCLTSTSP